MADVMTDHTKFRLNEYFQSCKPFYIYFILFLTENFFSELGNFK
jgi:hypothetical protein